jgi:site-specific DNA recombinase
MPAPSPVRLHPNLGEVYRRKVEELGAALRDPLIHDEALEIVRGLIDRLVVRPVEGAGFEIELVGDIARMVELGAGTERKKATLDERTACSVKVVAGTGFEPVTFRL